MSVFFPGNIIWFYVCPLDCSVSFFPCPRTLLLTAPQHMCADRHNTFKWMPQNMLCYLFFAFSTIFAVVFSLSLWMPSELFVGCYWIFSVTVVLGSAFALSTSIHTNQHTYKKIPESHWFVFAAICFSYWHLQWFNVC